MAIQDVVSTLLQSNNIVLFIILIVVFVVAYKILKAVIEIGLIAVTSGVFFAVISYLGIGPEITVSNFLTFMILGVALYITYSSLNALSKLFGKIWGGVKTVVSTITSDDGGGSGETSTTEKKVILKEAKDDD